MKMYKLLSVLMICFGFANADDAQNASANVAVDTTAPAKDAVKTPKALIQNPDETSDENKPASADESDDDTDEEDMDTEENSAK